MNSPIAAIMRRVARFLMVAAMLVSVPQTIMIGASQAMAFGGSMPHGSVTLSGAVHVHDRLARHVHMHGGDNSAEHHHHAPQSDRNDGETATQDVLYWSIGGAICIVPDGAESNFFPALAAALEQGQHAPLSGLDPDVLPEPPSTPGIV